MRRLKLTCGVTQRGLPVLVAAALSPAAGCGGDTDRDTGAVTSGGSGGTQVNESGGGTGGADTGLGGRSIVVGSGGGTGGEAGTTTTIDPRYEFTDGGAGGPDSCRESGSVEVVELPDEGTLADPETICASPAPAVGSGWAARVTLVHEGADSFSATGRIEIAAALADRVVGLPQLTVLSAGNEDLGAVQFSNLREDDGGFAFDATWTGEDPTHNPRHPALELLVSFAVRCDQTGQTEHLVEVRHALFLCGLWGDMTSWVSPGDDCVTCPPICEMAPSPIVPDAREDDLPLTSAVRLGLRLVARVGDSLVLLAEHDGGVEGVSYSWHASGGTLQCLAPDVAIWSPPLDSGPQQIQVAVESRSAAAVASYRHQRAA